MQVREPRLIEVEWGEVVLGELAGIGALHPGAAIDLVYQYQFFESQRPDDRLAVSGPVLGQGLAGKYTVLVPTDLDDLAALDHL